MSKILGLGRRAGGEAARTTAKTAAAEAARALTDVTEPSLRQEVADYRPRGFETLLFRQLPRPRLTERSASDLTIDEAKKYADQATRFYDYNFSLFAHGDFFYEEVEEGFLNDALGAEPESVDRRFLDVMTLFRRTLNDNTRSMLLCWAPFLYTAAIAAGGWLAYSGDASAPLSSIGIENAAAQVAAILVAAGAVGLFFAG
ncbi:MAG: hypothetical protein AAGJ87_09935, partial [Pseudomonadota bacterium]